MDAMTRPEPPHNEEAEQTVLGALLVNNRAFERVDGLKPEHFFDPANQKIFLAIAKMIERGRRADPITLRDRFLRDGDLADIGGPEYLARLAAAIVTVHNLEDYAEVIRDLYLRRRIIELSEDAQAAAYRGNAPSSTDPVTGPAILRTIEEGLFQLGEAGRPDRPALSIGDALGNALAATERAWKAGGSVTGITTGLHELDLMLGGLQPGCMYVLAGRPGMGKTALGVNTIGVAASRAALTADGRTNGCPVGVFELEMTADQLAQRMLAAETGIPPDRQQRGEVNGQEVIRLSDARATLAGLPMHIDDGAGLTVMDIVGRARKLRRRHGIGLLIVDHMQLIAGSSDAIRAGGPQGTAVVSEASWGLKALAKCLGVPLLVLAQLSREVEKREDKRPHLSDLRQSGTIEQDADAVIFIYRDEYYLVRSEPTRRADESEDRFNDRHQRWEQRLSDEAGLADIIIAKNRHGKTGSVRARWIGHRQVFADLHENEGGVE